MTKKFYDRVDRLHFINNMHRDERINDEQCVRMCRNFSEMFSVNEDEYYEDFGDEIRIYR